APQREDLALETAAIGELEHHQAALARDREHAPERRRQPPREQTAGALTSTFAFALALALRRGRRAEQPREGVAESTRRLEAVIEPDREQITALAHTRQRETHAPRAQVRVKGHPVVLAEVTPHARRIEVAIAQVLLGHPPRGIAIHVPHQLAHPV